MMLQVQKGALRRVERNAQNGGDADDCARRADDGDRDRDRDTRGGGSDGAWRRAWRGSAVRTRGARISRVFCRRPTATAEEFRAIKIRDTAF